MKASDHKYIDPNPQSEMLYTYKEYEGNIEMFLKTYLDDKFTIEGKDVDLSEGSDYSGLYVEGTHGASGDLEDNILHFRECTASLHEKIREDSDGNSIFDDNAIGTSVFLRNGCIKETKNTYYQKSSRVEWADETVRTFAKDQFNIQLSVDPNSDTQVRYSCDMVLCPLGVFKSETSPIADCFLADECRDDQLDRYANLFGSTRAVRNFRIDEQIEVKNVKVEGAFVLSADADWVAPTEAPNQSTPEQSTPNQSTPEQSTQQLPTSSSVQDTTSGENKAVAGAFLMALFALIDFLQ